MKIVRVLGCVDNWLKGLETTFSRPYVPRFMRGIQTKKASRLPDATLKPQHIGGGGKCQRLLVWAMSVVLSGCATTTPRHVDNLCSVFKQHPEWYADTKAVEKRWHVPQTTQMAIIHQESKFNARAKPERTKLLWVIPWTRPSSAYGYAQALNTTWSGYKRSTGRMFASRSNFADAADFIGWYAHQAHKRAGISPHNTKALYLAYHEGIGGYQRGTYWRKSWLVKVARKVETRAHIYEAQLSRCEVTVKRSGWLNWL